MPQLRSPPAEPVMRDLYRAYPAISKTLGGFTEAAMRGPSPLTQAQRELIAAFASVLNACAHCRLGSQGYDVFAQMAKTG